MNEPKLVVLVVRVVWNVWTMTIIYRSGPADIFMSVNNNHTGLCKCVRQETQFAMSHTVRCILLFERNLVVFLQKLRDSVMGGGDWGTKIGSAGSPA